MTWSRIVFAEGFESASSRWVQTVFQSLYEFADDEEFDALALYRDRTHTGVVLYLSPRGTERLRASMSRFELIDCARPDKSMVELVIGAPLATDPAWCELSTAERLAAAEAAYSSDLEVVTTPDDLSEAVSQ